jgi:glycosyltransferase involved in cell wall biosynthesis
MGRPDHALGPGLSCPVHHDAAERSTDLNVLIVDYEYPPLGGGGGILTRSLARELAKERQVAVLTTGTPSLPRDTTEDGVRVVRVPVLGRTAKQTASPISLATFPPSARLRFGALKGFRPDVVHTFFAIPSGPAGILAARHFRVPHVLTVIGADVHDPSRRFSPDRFAPLRAVTRRVIRSAAAVAAISSDIAERAHELSGRSDIEVIGCGVEPRPKPEPDRGALGWSDDDFVVVTTARLVPRKAIDVLIEAMRTLPENARLEIVGDGPERTNLEALAAATGRRITFAGDADDAARDLRIASADVFCQPSMHEGFGIAIVEAMAFGLPVIATDSGGPRDFVRSGRNGYLVPPGDAETLAARLADLAASRDLCARLGAQAARDAEGLSADAMTRSYLRIYERVRRA